MSSKSERYTSVCFEHDKSRLIETVKYDITLDTYKGNFEKNCKYIYC